MKKKKWGFILLSVLCALGAASISGCSGDGAPVIISGEPSKNFFGKPYTQKIIIENRLESDLPQLLVAISNWNFVAGYELISMDSGQHTIFLTIGDSEENMAVGRDGSPVAAMQTDLIDDTGALENDPEKITGCKIIVNLGYVDDWRIFAHEIGHCLGFPHSDDPQAVMYSLSPGNGFTEGMISFLSDTQ